MTAIKEIKIKIDREKLLTVDNETQINKMFDPITIVKILLPADYHRGLIKDYDLRH